MNICKKLTSVLPLAVVSAGAAAHEGHGGTLLHTHESFFNVSVVSVSLIVVAVVGACIAFEMLSAKRKQKKAGDK